MATADIYRALWRHKYFIGVLTAILVGAAWYFTSRQTPIYEAYTLVRIQQRTPANDPGEVNTALDLSERLALTYAKIVNTAPIYGRVWTRLVARVGPSPQEFHLSATPIEDTELLGISARSPDPRVAMLAANAVPPTLRNFIREKAALRDQIEQYDAARLPDSPVSPNLKMNLAIALLLGLMFNGALALLIAVLSDRLPDPDELEASVGRPVLATIPVLNFTSSRRRHEDTEQAEVLEGIPQADNGASRDVPAQRRSRVG